MCATESSKQPFEPLQAWVQPVAVVVHASRGAGMSVERHGETLSKVRVV
jgi:hypothetical protein